MKAILIPLLFICVIGSAQSTDKYLIKDVGYITIPSTMEIQSGNYKKVSEEYQKKFAEKFGYEVSDTRVVFQQKGLNSGDKSAYSSYARIILETQIGSYGDFEKITSKFTAAKSELDELSVEMKRQTQQAFAGTGLKLLSWYGVQLTTVNGRTAVKISYLRQLQENPPVYVTVYRFQNNDRMHSLTMSYRQQDASSWSDTYQKVLNSFMITNVR